MSATNRKIIAVAAQLGFEIELRRKHRVIVDPTDGGRVVGIMPRPGGGNESGRGHLNIIAQMRRARREQT